jgi:spoIIIJ-associated protein
MEEQVREALAGFFSGLLEVLGENGKAEIREEAGEILVNLRGRFKGLPGEDGEVRAALARLAGLHLRVHHKVTASVEVDINGQEEARRRRLLDRVLSLAEKVRAEQRRVELEPMPPRDRRLIHLALAGVPGVRTFSVGKGEDRRVVIAPEAEKISEP